MTVIESPLLKFGKDLSEGKEISRGEVTGSGAEPFTSFMEFEYVLPATFIRVTEMSDNEVIQLAESSGSFDFLDSPEEDVYNDLLKKRTE